MRPPDATATTPFVEQDVRGETEELPGDGKERWGTGSLLGVEEGGKDEGGEEQERQEEHHELCQ